MTDKNELQYSDLVTNVARRIPICLAIDLSALKHGNSKKYVDDAIKEFCEKINSNPAVCSSTDLCMIAYGENPKVVRQYSTLRNKEVIGLPSSSNETPNIDNLLKCMILEYRKRKSDYTRLNIKFQRADFLIFSSGIDSSYKDNSSIRKQVRQWIKDKKIDVHPILISDGKMMTDIFNTLTPSKKYYKIQSTEISRFLEEIGNSIEKLSQSTNILVESLLNTELDEKFKPKNA